MCEKTPVINSDGGVLTPSAAAATFIIRKDYGSLPSIYIVLSQRLTLSHYLTLLSLLPHSIDTGTPYRTFGDATRNSSVPARG